MLAGGVFSLKMAPRCRGGAAGGGDENRSCDDRNSLFRIGRTCGSLLLSVPAGQLKMLTWVGSTHPAFSNPAKQLHYKCFSGIPV